VCMNSRIPFSLVLISILSGCVHQGPLPKGYIGEVVTLWDNVSEVSSTRANFFEVLGVDDRNVTSSSFETREKSFKLGFKMSVMTLSREIPLNTESLNIGAFTYRVADLFGLTDWAYSVKGTVTVNLEQGETYGVNGQIEDDYSLLWIENEKTGVIVSDFVVKGSINDSYLDKLKFDRITRYAELNSDATLRKERENKLLKNAIEYAEADRCKSSEINKAPEMKVYLMAEALFNDRRYEASMSCFKTVSDSENVPKEIFKYISLMYDVGLDVDENPAKADHWLRRYHNASER
jgi:hypothetical protein